ncbi:ABC transporter permease [Conexibacter sp. CPCC 206217]|uniref:ABC transporter permease n=1 Tax=Conexibacter sp. CPCC 206217 TaxID=3064574 RepID=UPI0027249737|nr:ABC transporter permease [Conexibacter sp. CPCC 206217]MDO8212149.1 ABC transporter permease [Conexibacter sp. CPCC 206217]
MSTVSLTSAAAGRGGRWSRRLRTAAGRLAGVVGVLLAVATLAFLIQQLMPGDPATLILNQSSGSVSANPDPAALAALNAQYGFHDPLLSRYASFIGDVVRGDLGTSYQLHRPVTEIIFEQAGPTFVLTLAALVIGWILALALTLATARRGRLRSSLGSGFEVLAVGLPQYWLGIVLLVVFAIQLQWFPVEGGEGLIGLVLPALTLGIPLAGFLGQVTRDTFAKVLDEPFVTSARARGMGDLEVRVRHVLRHAVLPAITLSGWALGTLFSSAVIVETVFSRRGLGQVIVTAVNARDLPVVTGVVLLVAFVYVIANLLVDLAYTIVDPRMRAQ